MSTHPALDNVGNENLDVTPQSSVVASILVQIYHAKINYIYRNLFPLLFPLATCLARKAENLPQMIPRTCSAFPATRVGSTRVGIRPVLNFLKDIYQTH